MTEEKNNQGPAYPTYTISYRSGDDDKLAQVDHLVLGDENDRVNATGPFQRDHYAAAGLIALVQAGELTRAAAGQLVRTVSFASERIEINPSRRTHVSQLTTAMAKIANAPGNPDSTHDIAHDVGDRWPIIHTTEKLAL